MTTIAYRTGIMACDSCWAQNSVQTTSLTKIVRLASGGLFGSAGDSDDRTVIDLFKNVRSAEKLPSREALAATRTDMSAILVLRSGQVFLVSITKDDKDAFYNAAIWPANRGLAAVGSGAELAYGAMGHGATAKQAVAVACNWDINSRGPVHTVKLK